MAQAHIDGCHTRRHGARLGIGQHSLARFQRHLGALGIEHAQLFEQRFLRAQPDGTAEVGQQRAIGALQHMQQIQR